MKTIALVATAVLAPFLSAQTSVDLSGQFNADVFLEPGGLGLGDALDDQGRRIDAGTLPASFTDGSTVTTTNGRASFKFAPLKSESLDALIVNGQTVDVTDGNYGSVDLALLSAPGSFANPFPQLQFNYTDGSSSTSRLGPVAGWFNTPSIYENILYRYSDESDVETIVSFPTDMGIEEEPYIYQQIGNGLSGSARFVDGTGYALYRIGDLGSLTEGKLGITVGNNFVVSIATTYNDPDVSTTEGYTVLANSMEIYDGVEHRSNGNLKEYEFDVSEYLAAGTSELYILFTDATTDNGWGPYIQRIRLFQGTALNFEERLQPVVDASDATVYANFQIASTEETPFLYDNSGSGPSARGHRFADGTGSLTYRFDLPNDVTSAKLTVHMENNFVVSLAGPPSGTSYAKVIPGSPEEATHLIEDSGSNLGGNYRFADAASYMVYEFDLPDNVTTAFARVHVGNQFVIEAAGPDDAYALKMDWIAENGYEIQDNTNLDFYTVDVSEQLQNNPSKIVRIRLTDGQPVDGWGPYLRGIEIVDSEDSGSFTYTTVLNSQELFGEDIHNESNRGYYTIDLSSTLASNNPERIVFVKFTDGSDFDGWGPSLYWLSVYNGDLDVQADSRVFADLKSTTGEPAVGVNLIHRRYALDSSKTLASIKLPAQPADQTSEVYLLAATLNEGGSTGGEAPEISVAKQAGNTLRISWAATEGFRLQTTSSLVAPVQWSDVTATPATADGITSVDLPAANEQGYFRLVK